MKNTTVYKVVIMEKARTSSLVWTQFIRTNLYSEIDKYVKKSDCQIIYSTTVDEIDVEFLDKGIDELVNGEMIYHK